MKIAYLRRKFKTKGYVHADEAIEAVCAKVFPKDWAENTFVNILPFRILPKENREKSRTLKRSWSEFELKNGMRTQKLRTISLTRKDLPAAIAAVKMMDRGSRLLRDAIQNGTVKVVFRANLGFTKELSDVPQFALDSQWNLIQELGHLKLPKENGARFWLLLINEDTFDRFMSLHVSAGTTEIVRRVSKTDEKTFQKSKKAVTGIVNKFRKRLDKAKLKPSANDWKIIISRASNKLRLDLPSKMSKDLTKAIVADLKLKRRRGRRHDHEIDGVDELIKSFFQSNF